MVVGLGGKERKEARIGSGAAAALQSTATRHWISLAHKKNAATRHKEPRGSRLTTPTLVEHRQGDEGVGSVFGSIPAASCRAPDRVEIGSPQETTAAHG